jgi:purine-binding chemotaxis protein CheW
MAATDASESAATRTDAQVLEFRLGDETYCVDITYVAEIVDMGQLTQVPNTPAYVEGVIDLRGRTTSIVNPKTVLGIGDGEEGRRIIVLDPDRIDEGEALGWLVDEVQQVVDVDEDDVDDSPVADHEGIRGVIKRDDGFVIWLDPNRVG